MSDLETSSLVGQSVVAKWASTQEDVCQFGRLSCDDRPIHVTPSLVEADGLSRTIMQGSLMLGSMAGAWTVLFHEVGRPALSRGYDRLRFTMPKLLGDMLVGYAVVEHDTASGKLMAVVGVTVSGRLVTVATHIGKLL